MTVRQTTIAGVIVLAPRKFADARGYFVETYNRRVYSELGITSDFVQDNQSYSAREGTVRGLHFQRPPHSQAKLVRVLRGSILDVVVDLRVGSPTFGKWVAERLTAEDAEQLFVPRGFAHGFYTLEPSTEVAYKVDAFYSAECDSGIVWNDPTLNISWPSTDITLSEKDSALPTFDALQSPFIFGQ